MSEVWKTVSNARNSSALGELTEEQEPAMVFQTLASMPMKATKSIWFLVFGQEMWPFPRSIRPTVMIGTTSTWSSLDQFQSSSPLSDDQNCPTRH